jgi:hypothetical protein
MLKINGKRLANAGDSKSGKHNPPQNAEGMFRINREKHKMTRLMKSLMLLVSVACCSIAAAGTLYLGTSYTNSVSGWAESDQKGVYVPPHSVLTVTDCWYGSDTMQNMYLAQECDLYIPSYGVFVNDSDSPVYYFVELSSAVYLDSYDIVHCPASSGWVEYQIDPIQE